MGLADRPQPAGIGASWGALTTANRLTPRTPIQILIVDWHATMPQDSTLCPHLGLEKDASVRLSYADSGHRCFAPGVAQDFRPDTEHQLRFCLGATHTTCPHFQAADSAAPAPERVERRRSRSSALTPLRAALWVAVGLVAILVVWQVGRLLAAPAAPAPLAVVATATPTLDAPAVMPTPDPQFTAVGATATASAAAPVVSSLSEEVATPTVVAGDMFYNLAPEAAAVGWVTSSEARGNHLGDSFLHAGTVQGDIFHGVLQFDLTRVARGAPIRYAALTLTGLDDTRLDRASSDSWQLRWLAPEINEDWSRQTFQSIHNATVQQTILPALRAEELAPFAINQFIIDEAQLGLLQQALIDGQNLVAFRLDGPEGGADNLFTWDSGFGPATRQNTPGLWLVTGPAPATPPPVPTQDYVVVTSTPTPENVVTAAALQRTAVAINRIGTATPTPRNFVTATPTPLNESTAEAERLALGLPFVVTPTPQPLNAATATANAVYATAVAITTGTWTPLPTDYVTATPTPTFIVVTNTPTASTIFELLDRVIAEATRTVTAGAPTPFPPGVATATPTATRTPFPLNEETAVAQVIQVTIEAIAIGTWTPTPTATSAAAPIPTIGSASGITATNGLTQTTPANPLTITLQEGAPLASVASEIVNVRQGPAVSFGVIGQAPNGTQLSLVGRTADSAWLAVCCVNGQQGWVATYLLATDVDINTLPVTPAPTGVLAPEQNDPVVVRVVRVLRQSMQRFVERWS